MVRDNPASAEGDLARTPFAHLLVYALDRRLTGALYLRCPLPRPSADESSSSDLVATHVVRFARGTPVKVRPGDGFGRLGTMLVKAGVISDTTLRQALETKGLLGDVLIVAGCVDRATLERVAEEQFVERMLRLFACPPETTYAYCDGDIELIDWGGDPSGVDPLALLWH